MNAYVLSIAGIVLITAVVSIIAPSGKMGKFVKGILKLATLAVMIAPFAMQFGGDKFQFQSEEIEIDNGYLQTCAELLEEEDAAAISAYLQSSYSVLADVEVERDCDADFTRTKIIVKITDFGINGQDEHIDITNRILSALQERYGCATEVL